MTRRRTGLAAVTAGLAVAVVVTVYALAAPSPPPQPGITTSPPAVTSLRTATFVYTDTQSVTFECSRDGGGFTSCGGPGTSGSKAYSGLTAGSHTFAVRARSGTLASSATAFSWLIDLTAPTTPSLAFDLLSPNAFYRTAQNTLFFRPAAGGRFRVTASSTDTESGIRPGNAGYTFSSIAGGFGGTQSGAQTTYSFGESATQPPADPTVVATNNAGLDSAAASYHLRSDTVAPTGGSLTVNATAATAAGTASVSTSGTFSINRVDYVETPSATRSGLATSTLTREDAALTPTGCGVFGGAATLTGGPAQSVADGCYRYTLTGTDVVGNVAQVRTTVTVDRRPPALVVSFPAGATSYNAAGWTAGCGGQICGRATDPAGVARVQVAVAQVGTGRYWNGSSFGATSQTFVAVVLATPTAQATTWMYALPATAFPADGGYAVVVRATDTAGNATAAAEYATVPFTIDRTPPPAPTLTAHPSDPTQQHDATFAFTDTESSASFVCRVDENAPAPCRSPQSYADLAPGIHRFCVRAVDTAANVSAETCFGWQIAALLDFSIAGSAAANARLYPGGAGIPVNLVLTNPNSVPITVTTLTVTVTGTSSSACSATGFTVSKQLSATASVPAGATASLASLGIPQSAWPEIRMLDDGNQDACRAAVVALSFTGTALG
jgi:hypothetical protein